ncbi:MAG: ligase-associated DNA damage response endonuclease PdeM [Planctomycetota bacterium]
MTSETSNASSQRLEWAGESWMLLAKRAAIRERTHTAYVADLHFGKASAFRAAGVAVPGGTTERSLAQLSQVIDEHAIEQLIILGDCLHSKAGRADSMFQTVADWRERYRALDIVLVRGNHDDRAGDPPASWAMQCVDEPWSADGLVHVHDPDVAPGDQFTLAGHIHPAVRLRDVDRSTARFPCFWCQPKCMILPPFGVFTGHHVVRPRASDSVMIIVDEEIIDVSRHTAKSR